MSSHYQKLLLLGLIEGHPENLPRWPDGGQIPESLTLTLSAGSTINPFTAIEVVQIQHEHPEPVDFVSRIIEVETLNRGMIHTYLQPLFNVMKENYQGTREAQMLAKLPTGYSSIFSMVMRGGPP